MSEHLVTGYAGHGHVTSADAGRLNAGIVGLDSYVLETATKFSYTLVDNNTIKISSGDMVMQGRHISIPQNSETLLTIENGMPNQKRIDVVAMQYAKEVSTGIESAQLILIKGSYVDSGEPAPIPQWTIGDIYVGDKVNESPMYFITIDNMQVTNVEQAFEVLPSLNTSKSTFANHTHALATAQTAGFMSSMDKTSLDLMWEFINKQMSEFSSFYITFAEGASQAGDFAPTSTVQIRNIGYKVQLRGKVTFTMGSGTTDILSFPTDKYPVPDRSNVYKLVPCTGGYIAKIFVRPNGSIACDRISLPGSNTPVTGNITWLQLDMEWDTE